MLTGLNNYICDENDADECVRAWHIELWVFLCVCVLLISRVQHQLSSAHFSLISYTQNTHTPSDSIFKIYLFLLFETDRCAAENGWDWNQKQFIWPHFCSMRFFYGIAEIERKQKKNKTMKERVNETHWKWSTRQIPTTSPHFFFLCVLQKTGNNLENLFASISIACNPLCATE